MDKIDLIQRIENYLAAGGLANPELMDHERVRDLLIDCRDALAQPEQDAGKCGCGANLYIDENGKPCSKAQTEQEPVAWMYEIFGDTVLTTNQKKIDLVLANEKTVTPLYTAPPKQWVGLTDADLMKEFGYTDELLRDTAYRVQQKLKEMNK